MYGNSNVLDIIRAIMTSEETRLYIYDDSAYNDRYGILCPFHNPPPGPKRDFNVNMSSARIAVENSFGITRNLWTRHAFDKQMKLGLSPVATYYKTAILLTNCFTCIRGNQTSKRYFMRPPTLHEYLTGSTLIE